MKCKANIIFCTLAAYVTVFQQKKKKNEKSTNFVAVLNNILFLASLISYIVVLRVTFYLKDIQEVQKYIY